MSIPKNRGPINPVRAAELTETAPRVLRSIESSQTQSATLRLLATKLDKRAATWREDPPSTEQAAAWLERIARIMRAAA